MKKNEITAKVGLNVAADRIILTLDAGDIIFTTFDDETFDISQAKTTNICILNKTMQQNLAKALQKAADYLKSEKLFPVNENNLSRSELKEL
jgi:hypothetical protein